MGSVILPLFLGLLFTCALQPLAAWLVRCRFPTWAAALATIAVLAGAFVAVAWLTLGAVVDQWPAIEQRLEEAKADLVADATDAGLDEAAAESVAASRQTFG